MDTLTLTRVDEPLHASGDTAYAVTVDGSRVGYVGDYRPWRGDRWGARRWVAVHNPTGAPGDAQWESEGHRSRKAALAALLARTVDAELDDPRVW